MDFNEFTRQDKHCYALEEGFALRKIEANSEEAILTNIPSMILVLEGEMTIKIDHKQYLLTKHCFADTITRLSLELSAPSDDILAYQLLFTENFLKGLLKNSPPFSLSYVLEKKEQLISVLNPLLIQLLCQKIAYLEAIFQDKTHYFQAEMLKCTLWTFFLDISNAHLHGEEGNNNQAQETERKRILFAQFMKLLQDHIKEERSVNFYASKLCITPQYLNRIIKNLSGKTVYEWISTILTGEIYNLLESTNDPIQLLADQFNFADQATFTKFFKRQSGISPTEYRKKL